MAMSDRFREICTLLTQGTENGRLRWTQMVVPRSYLTRFGENLVTLSGEPWYGVGLRILTADGDEVDSITSRDMTVIDPDLKRLEHLWELVQKDAVLNDRLGKVAASLRAAVAPA